MPDLIQASPDMVLVPKSQFSAAPLAAVNVPEQVHEAHIPVGNNSGLTAARKYLELTRNRDFQRLSDLRAKPDPRVPMAAHLSELNNVGNTVKASNLRAFEQSMRQVDEAIRENEDIIATYGCFKKNEYAAEVRSVIRGMKQQEREAFIGNAAENMDEELLSAIMSAPAITVGVSAEFQSAHRNRYLQKIVPDYLALRKNLAATKKVLETAKPFIEETFNKAASGLEKFAPAIAEAERARAAIGN
jgi:hypothetical protein